MELAPFGMAGETERLAIAAVKTFQTEDEVIRRLARLCE